MNLDEVRVGVIGLGYVGLPLAVEFSKHFSTAGFDVDARRVEQIREGYDRTGEVIDSELKECTLTVHSDPVCLKNANFFIVTVPTPVDSFKRPDLNFICTATESVAALLKPGDTVVYESTVYPGVTEDICVPILEGISGLQFNSEFFVGYSPERINPGDLSRRVIDIIKVTSGSTPAAAVFIDAVYGKVIPAGTFKAASIKVAEAAKVIENTQRDVNIALVNEFTVMFNKLELSYTDVMAAASTKWNFLPFEPGLVGGHCIGVDPYYLLHKAHEISFHPQLIEAARRINDHMPLYVARRLVELLADRRKAILGARILVLGLAFKENCPDLRNSKIVELVRELSNYGAQVDVHDPVIDADEAVQEYGIVVTSSAGDVQYDAVVVAVRHNCFREAGVDSLCRGVLSENGLLLDLKNAFPECTEAVRL